MLKHIGQTDLTENRRELVDTLYLVVLQGVNKILPLLILSWLMLKLGAVGTGYTGFALSVVQYAVLLIDFGFDLSATKRVAIERDNPAALTRTFWAVVWAKVWLLAVSVVSLLLLVAALPTLRSYSLAIYCTLPMALGSAFTFTWMFQGIGKVRLMAILNTCSKILVLPLIFLFVHEPADYPWAAFLHASVHVLTAVVSCVWLWRHKVVGKVVYRMADIRDCIRESWPLFLSRASTSVYTQLFVIILGVYCAADAVGRYTSSEAVMRALCFVLYVPLTQAFFPRISNVQAHDRAAALRMFRTVRVLVLLCMAVVSAVLFVLATFFIGYLGESYRGIHLVLQIMSPAPVFIGLGAVYGQMGLIALGNERTRRQFRNVYVLVAVVSIAAVFALVRMAGEVGASVALLLSEVLVCCLMIICCRRSKVLCQMPVESVQERRDALC